MTFWMLDADAIDGQPPEFGEFISMPEYNERDWTGANAQRAIKESLIAHDHDSLPPDHWASIAQTIWQFIHRIEEEDIICAIHKKNGKPAQVYFAEVTGSVMWQHERQRHVVPIKVV